MAQLAAEREANRENRRIIAGLIECIPELEAPSEPQNQAESAEPRSDRGTHPRSRRGPQNAVHGGVGCLEGKTVDCGCFWNIGLHLAGKSTQIVTLSLHRLLPVVRTKSGELLPLTRLSCKWRGASFR